MSDQKTTDHQTKKETLARSEVAGLTMTLPVLRSELPTARSRRTERAICFHLIRIGIFCATLFCLRLAAPSTNITQAEFDISLSELSEFFPSATQVVHDLEITESEDRVMIAQIVRVLDKDGNPLGFAIQTSPMAAEVIGFSGPTNVLLVFDPRSRIVGARIRSSRDTREHVALIDADGRSFENWIGQTWNELANSTTKFNPRVDGVSGATLTCLAICESVSLRLSGNRPTSLRFPDEISLKEARLWSSEAVTIETTSETPALVRVRAKPTEGEKTGKTVGTILRTSPAADSLIGYQGPTDTMIAFDDRGKVKGIRLRKSFDNAEYVKYVREDDYFLSLFNGRTLSELAELDLEEAEIEGVSGATMTSMTVAEGIVLAAKKHLETVKELEMPAQTGRPHSEAASGETASPDQFDWRFWATVVVVATGICVSARPGKHRRGIRRRVFQIAVISVIGVLNGDLLSQAILVGWTQHGAPLRFAPGLVLVAAVGLLWPMLSRQQIYCQHLCPHGLLQQAVLSVRSPQMKLSRWARVLLIGIPPVLLGLVVCVVIQHWNVSLVDLEPFDAWVIGVGGFAATVIAIVGLIASFFVPMAYCKFGCPTGAVLNFLRFNGRSDQWHRRDSVACLILALAIALSCAG